MTKIGIKQGRLSPPKNKLIQNFPLETWKNEFLLSKKLGLKSIEWVFEKNNFRQNPIYQKRFLNDIIKIVKKTGVKVNSLVADYFMQSRLFGEKKEIIKLNISILKKLINNCNIVGINIIVIPLLDNSSLKNKKQIDEFKKNLLKILNYSKKKKVRISLETDLQPRKFLKLIESFSPAKVYANFDMGNSAALNYDPENEIEILKNHIINVHIKDRLTGGSTVPLGEGNVDFKKVFKKLKNIKYNGELILETARKDLNHTKKKENFYLTIKNYISFIKKILEKNK